MTSKSAIKSAIPSATNNALKRPEFVDQSNKLTHLTKREQEILLWLSEGKSSFEISVILGICESTVKFHVNNTLTKLDATNRTHAVAKALRLDLI